jgi:FkbM family methyltransferase
MSYLKSAVALAANPFIACAYARWSIPPARRVRLPWGGGFSGFRGFSEFLSCLRSIPPPQEIAFICEAFHNGGTGIDVGANLGLYSHLMASAGASLVYAFEPLLSTHERLCRNLQGHRATAIQAALSDACGTALFTDKPGDYAQNHVVDVRTDNVSDTPTVVVTTTTLDNFCADRGIGEVAFLKIDAEGHETHIIRGASNLLRDRAIKRGIIEIVPDALRAAGTDVDTLVEEIRALGYDLHRIMLDGTLSHFASDTLNPAVEWNFALLPRWRPKLAE